MKIDMTPLDARLDAAQNTGPRRGDRWLAQLEKAALRPWHADSSPSQEGGDARAPAPRDDASSPARQGPVASPRGAATPPATSTPGSTPVAAWVGLATMRAVAAPTAAPAHPEVQVLAPLPQASRGSAPGIATPADAAVEPIASVSPLPARTRPLAAHREDNGGADPQLSTAPPRYARQFMQLSLSESGQAQASVRDTSLSAEGAAAVAHGVAAQLRADGVVLQRVFVNGRRFDLDASPAGQVPPVPDMNPKQE